MNIFKDTMSEMKYQQIEKWCQGNVNVTEETTCWKRQLPGGYLRELPKAGDAKKSWM